jgi:NAD(P)-dependent dehydrogenase (short-subunit alcohol dehydrogenase family)
MSHGNDFHNKVVLVAGAGTGIGAATAILLAGRGAKVAIIGCRQHPLREVADAITATSGDFLVLPADVSDADAVHAAVTSTVDHYGGLHCALNNAGISSESHDLPELPVEVWDNTVAINLSSMFYDMRAQLPAIAASGGGATINISSIYADRGFPT